MTDLAPSNYQKLGYYSNNGVATITLNDPATLNALDDLMINELKAALDTAEYDPNVAIIVLTGEGRAFSSGGNVRQMAALAHQPIDASQYAYRLASRLGEVCLQVRRIPKPVIARINGAAVGAGMNLTLACDFRIASADAKFLQAFINIGLIPDAGGLYLLNQLIGAAKTTELAMLGEQFDSQKAQDWGLVHRIVPAQQLDEAVATLANHLSRLPVQALAAIKHSINQLAFSEFAAAIDQEVRLQMQMATTENFKEGVTAFVEKRPAKFNQP